MDEGTCISNAKIINFGNTYMQLHFGKHHLSKHLAPNPSAQNFKQLCPKFDDLCMNDGSKYLDNSSAIYNIP